MIDSAHISKIMTQIKVLAAEVKACGALLIQTSKVELIADLFFFFFKVELKDEAEYISVKGEYLKRNSQIWIYCE